jgi:hypothetical protein
MECFERFAKKENVEINAMFLSLFDILEIFFDVESLYFSCNKSTMDRMTLRTIQSDQHNTLKNLDVVASAVRSIEQQIHYRSTWNVCSSDIGDTSCFSFAEFIPSVYTLPFTPARAIYEFK